MEALRQYVLTVTAAAILCGLVTSIVPAGRYQKILRLVCGIFLALLVVEPVTRLDPLSMLSRIGIPYESDGQAAAAFGEELARDSVSAYIKEQAQAYILDKAESLGVSVEADVTVGQEDLPVPVAVRIRGNVPAAVRDMLEQWIVENLGIAKENLQWIG